MQENTKKKAIPEGPITDQEEGEIPPTTAEGRGPPRGRRLMIVSLGALGVVYGDIGTSPLYALRECFSGEYGLHISDTNVLGLLSLVFWSLFLIIAIKYLVLVMEADNRGEGGILALMALVRAKGRRSLRAQQVLVTLGLFGAALLYGDAMITPAISVLSAAEGIHVAAPALRGYVVTITVAILTGLFFSEAWHCESRVSFRSDYFMLVFRDRSSWLRGDSAHATGFGRAFAALHAIFLCR